MTKRTIQYVAAVIAVVGVTASAQELQGPERLPGWSFIPTVSIGSLFDSNLALSSPRADLGETQGDTLFTIEPSGELSFLNKRTDFSAQYSGYLRRYVDVDALNGFDQRASISLRRAASKRINFFLNNYYADVPTTDETELNGVPFRRTGSQTNRFAGGVDGRLNRLTTLSGRYDMTWSRFDQTDAFLNDGIIHAFQGNLMRLLNETLAVGADYVLRLADIDEGRREMTFHDAGGNVSWDVTPHTKITGAAGYSTMFDELLDERRSGAYFRGAVDHMTSRATIGASFARQFLPSFGFGGANRNQELSAYLRAPLSRRMYARSSFTWRHYIPFEVDSVETDTYWIRGSVGYAAAQWARVEGFYTFTRQDSVVTGGEVNRHRIGVQLVLSQPVRIQ